jgi:hypothetical protein
LPAVPRPFVLLTTFLAVLVAAHPAAAQTGGGGVEAPDLSDPCPADYPGDDATKARIARWMARGAAERGLPRELPVMAGIAESGLQNLKGPIYSGFFGMHMSLSSGPYRLFPTRPARQLLWFTDTAVWVRQRRLAEGRPDPTGDPDAYGIWIADVERPAPENRSGYQQHLTEARRLIAGRCQAPARSDNAPPDLRTRIARRQRASIVLKIRCPSGDCFAGATAEITAGERTAMRRAAAIDPGEDWATLSVPLSTHARRMLARGRAVSALVTAHAADEAANVARFTRRVRVLP